ncbi:Regulatory protein recX (modular protein) [Nostocoides japonicum T1-X7]|uniref:Regulatory protein RecX n=1 Tax=Nostocoides japonicum T1-X7 TaxID=1194083 RepID=A0A077M3Y1_9MICO|nr:regulatory protein RecX [Tetrasphaera japonica]CCH78889.1 Regulatory protein recX (modular protein) [Tetrasphaera japonica T1-X7]
MTTQPDGRRGGDAAAALDELRAAVARLERGEHGELADLGELVDEAPDGETPEDGAEQRGDPYAVARAIVLRQLTNAPKTREQLRQALARKGCPPDVAESVLDRMTEVGLVDDAAYAEMLVRSKQAGAGLARRALAHQLRTKGVDDDTAAAVLDDVDPAQERRRARELVDKRLRTLHGLDVTVQTRRLAGMLARKGYPGDVAYAVIRDALADAPEHRRD